MLSTNILHIFQIRHTCTEFSPLLLFTLTLKRSNNMEVVFSWRLPHKQTVYPLNFWRNKHLPLHEPLYHALVGPTQSVAHIHGPAENKSIYTHLFFKHFKRISQYIKLQTHSVKQDTF